MTSPFSVRWVGNANTGYLELLDQTLLPLEERTLKITEAQVAREAITSLRVRGAPAIGAAGAYALVLAARTITESDQWHQQLKQQAVWLNESRPTAVNLSWALNRLVQQDADNLQLDLTTRKVNLLNEANRIVEEDRKMCEAMGKNGAALIGMGCGVLTHCNTGMLATAGEGTALAAMYHAHRSGVQFKVYADETRPLLQGARLTTWELRRAGIDVTLVCEGMAGMLMSQGKIQLVMVGADRIAQNGDTANKVGTYSLAILAHYHKLPFYVVAPSSTFDLKLEDGSGIPIEQRKPEEVSCVFGHRTAPENIKVFNPAFDVTPGSLITGVITEKGIINPVNRESVLNHWK